MPVRIIRTSRRTTAIGRLRGARAAARELAWARRAETRCAVPLSKAADYQVAGLVIDIDASIVECHSEKENGGRVNRGIAASAGSA